MSKMSRATIAEQTLKVIERGCYSTTSSKKPIQLDKQLKQAVDNTLLYTPGNKRALFRYAKNEIKLSTFTSSLPTYLQASVYDHNVADEGEEDSYIEPTDTYEPDTTTTATITSTTTTTTNENSNDTAPAFTSRIFSNQPTQDDKPTTAADDTTTTTTTTTTGDAEATEATEAAETTDVTPMATPTYQTKFEVRHGTTLESAYALAFDGKHSKVCVLNFASAKNPGGGFLGGAQAQEESLARSSGLYPCLTSRVAQPYYNENKRDKTCVYTHHIIYSPLVPVFRSDEGDLLEQPYFPSFLTAPAVNWGAAFKRVRDPVVLVNAMKERAAMFLGIAAKHSEDTLVLGAWGCGVFRFPPEICAEIFYSLLVPATAPFYNAFKHVVFAITDPKLCTLFSKVLAEGPVAAPVALTKSGRRDESQSRGHNNGRHGGNDRRGGNSNKKKDGAQKIHKNFYRGNKNKDDME